MLLPSFPAGLEAASPNPFAPIQASAILAAGHALLARLVRGEAVDAHTLRDAMTAAAGGGDAEGAWSWKDAYEAGEVAQLLFLRRFGAALAVRPPAYRLAALGKLAALLPTHTKRSTESAALQQFSTPLPLGLVAALAAGITPDDVVLEPSAGTGLLAICAEIAGARLALNELGAARAAMLGQLFPAAPVTRCDAAQIDDHLDIGVRPSVVLMNPPFSVAAHVDGRVADAAWRHLTSALARLQPGGRLVAITGAGLSPESPSWREAFVRLQANATVVFSAGIAGHVYARHGTTAETRLTVIDRVAAADPSAFPASLGLAPDTATLLGWVLRQVPPRPTVAGAALGDPAAPIVTMAGRGERRAAGLAVKPVSAPAPEAIPLAYATCTWTSPQAGALSEALYEPYALQTIRIVNAQAHPTPLVQSAAMASVALPRPSYRPHLPDGLVAAGLLSDAQLETVIQAGEAHAAKLAGSWTVDATCDRVTAAPENTADAVRFRRGFMLGDGTGAGKGRQVAGILLDNWLKGRRRAVWVSKSDTLIEDARRDWAALGQERLQVTPLARFRQGAPIRLDAGILFTTYAMLRSDERDGKASRVRQIADWLGRDFDGVIVFDESHALQNAGGGTSERGDVAPSQQGRAGLRLQHALPDARVLYVSATGATTVHNLAYAQRLGLWGGADFPFATRAEFVQAIEAGGVAAMEVLARDLKALGLYTARSLSYAGVRYELVEHRLTAEQTRIYDAYAGAFEIIHNNLTAALQAANITGECGTLNAQAKSAARSAFESAKQRFFNHLITAMKVPTLIAAITRDLEAGHAALVQIVSTGEALLERRLAAIPTAEWGDVSVDITPREYVLDYLAHSFPTQLFEPFTDGEGNLSSRPVLRDGQPVQCREAVRRREALIERLAALPPVAGALDLLVQHFGTDQVAEVTGRSRRIVRKRGSDGLDRLAVENRAASANLAEAQAFQDDAKRILVFSDAGGTGRSYHADLGAKNQRLRVHYLLEPGWKADAAIQGLGRSNRTNQAQPPLFRPVATNVKAEKRFLSTIARRLDTLGAITRGQRQTGGQGLFRTEDNLESAYARAALRQLYQLLFAGKVAGCTLQRFSEATGLELTDRDGSLREELPPITTFLNRLLALPIALQDALFGVFEELLEAKIEGAIAAGVYDRGVETVSADSLRVTTAHVLATHAATGAETRVLTLARKDRNVPLALAEALARGQGPGARLLVNAQSGRAAVQVPAPGLMLEDGSVAARARLLRPLEHETHALDALAHSHWQAAEPEAFAAAWEAECAGLPEFRESTLHIVTGLLLPVWRRLPAEACRVVRLQTDDGERLIGRLVPPDWVAAALPETAVPPPGETEAWAALQQPGARVQLADGLALRRVTVMNAARIELTGFTDGQVERLKASGLFAEIIAWRLRLFVPVGEGGSAVLSRLVTRFPIARLVTRAAA